MGSCCPGTGRGRGGGRCDAAGPRKGGGPPRVLLMGLSYFVGPRTADRGQLASLSLLAPHCVPCLPLRPTSEEALKWGESLEKLLVHKCKWGPPGLFPSPCPLPRPPLPGLGPPGLFPSPCPLPRPPVLLSQAQRVHLALERLPVPVSRAVRCPRCWERLRPLVWPWSLLLPAPPCP